ncbi:hypothetical protein K7X08_001787 [Anisodus acutangulus]|uniref:AAA+ ATPase domain-containing protein n=1 Tax=Anisodus acutangulus TaxID=402998 RepID=A0A9Q1LMZ8_9SOLA|nr:hypothetical protein K7X08_001787 [Anisodus acutangulus]
MPSSKTILTAATSLTASAILFRSIASDLVPEQLQLFFSSRFQKLSNRLSSQLIVVIEECEGLTSNQMFDAVNVYLGTKVNAWTQRIKVNKPDKDEELAVTVDRYQEVTDYYENVTFTWIMKSRGIQQSEKSSNPKTQLRYFELSFHKKQKEMALKSYLPYIVRRAKEIKEEKRVVRLHTVDYNRTDYWSSVVLNHPATFKDLIEDLDMFVSRKDYYRRIGKAWKRGYLLYGPPGTWKSSLVAAMANYLKFDVYDLDLREVQCNSDLRRLLIGSANRSILVIEDIDCNVGLQNRENENDTTEDDKITLSGLLNFIDGLWSSCGDERIIVFTTNHKDRLDPALLRPGRMDVHIEMSHCTFSGFRILASNYLKVDEHRLFTAIEDLFERVKVTPAEVAGELMKSNNSDIVLESLIKFLQNKEHEGVTTS